MNERRLRKFYMPEQMDIAGFEKWLDRRDNYVAGLEKEVVRTALDAFEMEYPHAFKKERFCKDCCHCSVGYEFDGKILNKPSIPDSFATRLVEEIQTINPKKVSLCRFFGKTVDPNTFYCAYHWREGE